MVMFKMNSLLILLFISWISYAVSIVVIKGGPHIGVSGNNFIWKCQISGNDTFEAWKNPDGVVVHNSTGFEYSTLGEIHKLKILKVEVHDGGSWVCTSKEGNNDSAILTVLVSETPAGSANKTQYLQKDLAGIIKVNILGYPKPTFEWKKDGNILSLSTSRYSIGSGGSLLISKVDLNDEGKYSVTAMQGSQEVDVDDITVHVHAVPTFNTVSINEARTRGGNITFECNVTGSPTPSISWKHDSKDINADSRHEITTSGLTVKDIKKSDVGEYTCVASNIVGTEKQTSKLSSVLVPPTVQPISDKEVEKGNQLNVYCNVSGDPQPEVKWMKNGSVLSVKQILIIDNMQSSNSGTYECSAKNKAVDERGKEIVESQSMTVVVVSPPEFDLTSTSKIVPSSPNKPVEIKCSASGYPAPTLTLSFGNKYLEGTLRNESSRTSLVVSFNFTKSSLGEYICTASNKLNKITHPIKVFIPLDIPKITNVKPGCNNVSFSWLPDTKNSVKIKKIVVKLNQSNVFKESNIYTGGDVSQSSFVGLEENSKYVLSVTQVTEVSGIGHTAKKSFNTEVCAPQQFNRFVVTGNEIELYWPQATEDVEFYIVKYRIKNSEEWRTMNITEVTTKISGLDYGATYEFQVFLLVAGVEKTYTLPRVQEIAKDPSTDQSNTSKPEPTGSPSKKTREQPGTLARKKGLSGGVIAAIVIVIILLVLIAVDVFCCFFNQCGVVHMCAAACSGKSRSKYEVDGHNPEEGTELKANEENKELVA